MKFRVLVWIGVDGKTYYFCNRNGGALWPAITNDMSELPYGTHLFCPSEEIPLNYERHITGSPGSWFVLEVET